MMDVERTIHFVPWYTDDRSPLEASVRRGEPMEDCEMCGGRLAMKSQRELTCGACGRRHPVSIGEDHTYALKLRFTIRRGME